MAVGRVFKVRPPARAAMFAAIATSIAFLGCGGADQTTGTQAEPDAEAAKRQDDMRKFYANNPLNKTKGKKSR